MTKSYTRPRKYSILVAGHRTSITLEPAFMDTLKRIARELNLTPPALVKAIDAEKGDAGLSSAIRVYILRHYQSRCTREKGPSAPAPAPAPALNECISKRKS